MKKVLVFVAKTTGFECLKWLLENHPHDEYEFFVSPPDKPLIADYLKVKGYSFHDLETCDPEYLTKGRHFDWIINIWSPYIFRKPLLDRVQNSVNLHPSYLPFGRGRDPVVWAIKDGAPAGATLHKITEGIDEGPIFAQIKVEYDFPVTGQALYQRVEKACIDVFCQNWAAIRENRVIPKEQGRPDLPTRRRADLTKDRVLDLQNPDMAALILKILAHDFSENGYTALLKQGEKTYSVSLQIKEEPSGGR